jgi:hypothetical protein
MKKHFYFYLLLSGSLPLLWFSSCTKDKVPEQLEKTNDIISVLTRSSGNNIPTDGDITVVAIDYLFGKPSHLDNLDITGYFKNSSGNGVPVNNFVIGNYVVSEQQNNHYSIDKATLFSADSLLELAATSLYGQNINYTFTSSAFGNVSATQHMSAALGTIISSQSKTSIQKSSSLQVNWQTDPYTGDGQDDETVVVAIVYHAGNPVNQEQEGMPTENIIVYKQANDPAGSVVFSSGDLSVFPLNSYVNIYNGRVHQKIVTSSTGKTLAITNLVMSTSMDMKIQ